MFNKKIVIAAFSLTIPFLPLRVLGQDTAGQGYVGFAVEDSNEVFQEVGELTLDDTKECIDKVPGKKIAFISDNTPTVGDRRVIITNVTQDSNNNYLFGDADSLPYTDREYEQDSISEDIKVAIGLEHDDDKLVVAEGQNQFKYEIVDITEQDGQELETIVEDGEFSLAVKTPKPYNPPELSNMLEFSFANNYSKCELIEQQEEAERQQWIEEENRRQEEYRQDSQREWEEELKQKIREDSDRRLQESLQEDLDDRWQQDRFQYEYEPQPDLQQQIREDSTRELLEDLRREY